MTLCMDGIEKLLALIRDKIPEGEEQDEVLWAILTAFRGPDLREGGFLAIKLETTQQIRDFVYSLVDGIFVRDETYQPAMRRSKCIQVCGSHYTMHLQSAERAIQKLDPNFRIFKEL